MDKDNTLLLAIVSAVSTILGGFLGKGVSWLRARSKNRVEEKTADSNIKTSEIEKAAVLYRDMIEDLRKDIDELYALLKILQEERLLCREENAKLKEELKFLKSNQEQDRKEIVQIKDVVNQASVVAKEMQN